MKDILIVGASSNLAECVIPKQIERGHRLGLHAATNPDKLKEYQNSDDVLVLERVITSFKDCDILIKDFFRWNHGLDALLILMGGVMHPVFWANMDETYYLEEYRVNTLFPVRLATVASKIMKGNGGNIVFVSTASASHGGGSNSLGYGMAKSALECAVKRLAKELAADNIQVNAIAPGFMDTDMQARTKGMLANENKERLATIPVGRAGTKNEFADLVDYLLNADTGFLTGQVIALDGGDFI